MCGMTFHASPDTRRFAFAYSTSPRATGSTSARSSSGSIWLSAAMTQVTSIPSSCACRYPVAMAAPTPPFCSRRSTSTRGSPTSSAAAAVPSRDASSTMKMRSTNSGMPRSVSPTSCSSSNAGTTTATRLPSSISPRSQAARSAARRSRRPAPPRGARVDGERGDGSQDQADQRTDEERGAARAGCRLARARGLDDPARLDVLGQVQELLGLADRLLERRPPRIRGRDHRVQVGGHEQALVEREGAGADDRGLLRLSGADARVGLVELRLLRRHLRLEELDLLGHVHRDPVGDAVGECIRGQLDLPPARPLHGDLDERIDPAELAGLDEL